MKILVIEDQPDIRATLKDLLEINGHEVLEAEDGVQGVRRAAEKPEFIFCDVTMPNLDGHGALAAIRQMPEVCEVPFVFLTANADRSDQRAGMSLGADDYITKPFTEADIVGANAARTRRQQGVRERIQQLTAHHQRAIGAQWSHELLTPLNAILGSLELLELEAGTIDRQELKEMLALIRQGAERQERLSRKLIRYFGLERMALAPAGRGHGSCAADRAIHEGAVKAAREANRAGQLRISAVPAPIGIDHDCLKDAVYETVSNAFTFSPPGENVTVSGALVQGRYRIEISDRGSGMKPEQRSYIAPFAQFERKNHEQQGLGLGLAIARSTATLAGGDLKLCDGAGGVGLSVIFDLPVALERQD